MNGTLGLATDTGRVHRGREALLRLIGLKPRPVRLPPARALGWRLKPVESARTAVGYHGSLLVATIVHERLSGVTPRMVEWWFRNIGGEMEVAGTTLPRYLVWHPFDHISWSLVGNPARPVGVGSRFHIVEAFGRRPQYLVDVIDTVAKLDDTGIRLVQRRFGKQIFSLEHTLEPVPGGTLYRSTMTVGMRTGILSRLFNRLVLPHVMSEEMAHAWIRHNVEEVGNLENFLPGLYRRSHAAKQAAGARGLTHD